MSLTDSPKDLTRRRFLLGAGKCTAASVIVPSLFVPESLASQIQSWLSPSQSTPVAPKAASSDMILSFYNRHTGESIKNCTFWSQGDFVKDGLRDIKKMFRDHRTGDAHDIDRNLLKLLHNIMGKLDSKSPIHLISGYRSPKTNRMLCDRSKGVARTSQHLLGKAADIVVPGHHLRDVQKAAKSLGVGGVGRYSEFVHVDTGRKRYWGMA